MRIEMKWTGMRLILSFAVFTLLGFSQLRSATVEIEDDDEAVDATPTVTAHPMKAEVKAVIKMTATPETASPKKVVENEEGVSEEDGTQASTDVPDVAKGKGAARVEVGSGARRARISDDVGFYYFLKSGSVSPDPDQLPAIGKVATIESFGLSYSTPKKTYILLEPKAQKQVKAKDLLVVYRAKEYFQEAKSGFSGYCVQNLAVVKVLEVQQRRCLVQVVESFFPFEDGDPVRLYEDELSRWKQSQVNKNLPEHAVKCYVAGGENMDIRHFWTTSDFIILTAGSKKGIVEGQEFELRKFENRLDKSESLHIPVGNVEVFYAGPNYSLARIKTSHIPVEAGFEAFYDPAGEK